MSFYTINSNALSIKATEVSKILLHHYIIRTENLQRMKGDLPRGQFKMTLRGISTELKVSISTARKLVQDFFKLGIIKYIKKSSKPHEPSIYEYIFGTKDKTTYKTTKDTTKETPEISEFKTFSEVVETVNETTNKTVKCTLEKELTKKSNEKDIYDLVIGRLNLCAKKNFKSTIPKTRSFIKARLREKFTVEDFYTVIDNKVAQWMGTDKEIYLRPQTLFGTRFEGYLNEVNFNTDEEPVTVWRPEFEYD